MSLRHFTNTKCVVTTYQVCSVKLKMHQKPLFGRSTLGELTTLPKPPSRLGRGTLPPHSPPPRRLRRLDLGAYGASSPLTFLVKFTPLCVLRSFAKYGGCKIKVRWQAQFYSYAAYISCCNSEKWLKSV